MKYITVDESGNITGMYLTDPGNGVSLSDSDWVNVGPGYSYINGKIIAPTALSDTQILAAAITTKKASLSLVCQAYLYDGFSSAALGTAHEYPSAQTDQQNLANAVATGSEAFLWCSNTEEWQLTSHTADQIKQVNIDWVAYLNNAQAKLVSLLGAVVSATSVDAVAEITW